MKVVNRWIGVHSGYLGDFSYRSHSEFYPEYCNLDIDPDGFAGTTRERFIEILKTAQPRDQAKILRGVLERFPLDSEYAPTTRTPALKDELLSIAARIEGASPVESPNLSIASEVVERAISDAETLIQSSGATSGVDRIHTALHGYLLAISETGKISHGQDATIAQLFKAIREHHPSFAPLGPRSGDITQVLRAMASIVDALQPLRNRASVAHPNELLLEAAEAMLAINAARTILHYVNAKLASP